MIKKVLTLLIAAGIVCCGCTKAEKQPVQSQLDQIKSKGEIVVGVKIDAFPFGGKDKYGHHVGFDPALARIIAKDILGNEKSVKFVPVTSTNRMMKLYSNEIDMIIATMSITPKRQELLDFSIPYYTAGQAIMVKKNSSIKTIKDLSKKKVIIVFGSTSEMSLRAAIPNCQIVGYKTYDAAYWALKNGKASAIVSDDTILMNYALNDPSLKLLPKRYTKEPYAVAFRKGEESQELIDAVNEIIKNEKNKLITIQKNLGIK